MVTDTFSDTVLEWCQTSSKKFMIETSLYFVQRIGRSILVMEKNCVVSLWLQFLFRLDFDGVSTIYITRGIPQPFRKLIKVAYVYTRVSTKGHNYYGFKESIFSILILSGFSWKTNNFLRFDLHKQLLYHQVTDWTALYWKCLCLLLFHFVLKQKIFHCRFQQMKKRSGLSLFSIWKAMRMKSIGILWMYIVYLTWIEWKTLSKKRKPINDFYFFKDSSQKKKKISPTHRQVKAEEDRGGSRPNINERNEIAQETELSYDITEYIFVRRVKSWYYPSSMYSTNIFPPQYKPAVLFWTLWIYLPVTRFFCTLQTAVNAGWCACYTTTRIIKTFEKHSANVWCDDICSA